MRLFLLRRPVPGAAWICVRRFGFLREFVALYLAYARNLALRQLQETMAHELVY